MAKYNWSKLEKEYILGDYKSVSAFLKEKKIPRNGSVQKAVKGWNKKKVQKEQKKSSKVIEKVIEKESTQEAQKIVTVDSVANKLLEKISDIVGKSEINEWSIKKITSSLKDISDILNNNNSHISSETFASEIEKAWRDRNEQ